MKKEGLTYLVIFGVVILIILLAPYLLRIFGAATSVGIGSIVCFAGPYSVDEPDSTQYGVVGEAFSVNLYFKDSDSDHPDDLTVTEDSGLFTITTTASSATKTKATLSATPTSAGSTSVTVTASDGVCSVDTSFTFDVSGSTTSTGGGGGSPGPSSKVYVLPTKFECGGDTQCLRGSYCQDGFCLVRSSCSVDKDCPDNFECGDNLKCSLILEEIEEKIPLEEKPVEKKPPIEEKPIIIFEPLKSLPSFFNKRLIDSPSSGIIEALRQGLLVSPSKIDLSPYNLYREHLSTDLGLFFSENQLLRNILLGVLAFGFVLVSIQIVRKSKKDKRYTFVYLPPEEI